MSLFSCVFCVIAFFPVYFVCIFRGFVYLFCFCVFVWGLNLMCVFLSVFFSQFVGLVYVCVVCVFRVCVYLCLYVCVSVCMNVSEYMFVCSMCRCVCVCM